MLFARSALQHVEMAVPMQQFYAVDLLARENQKIRRRYRCALASGAVSQVNCSLPNLNAIRRACANDSWIGEDFDRTQFDPAEANAMLSVTAPVTCFDGLPVLVEALDEPHAVMDP
jgi:hypothetical protein